MVYSPHNHIALFNALNKGEEVSAFDAITKYGISSLSVSVWHLKKDGVKIETFKDKKGVKRYRLK